MSLTVQSTGARCSFDIRKSVSCFGIYALLQCPALLQMRVFVWEKVLQERRCAWTLTLPACDGNDCIR